MNTEIYNGVELTTIKTTEEHHRIPYLKTLLSEEEIKKAERYHFDRDRNQYIVCRGTLRELLSKKTGNKPENITFTYNQWGKPSLEKPHNNLCFNVSHSGEYALIGICEDREIGVDVEQIKTMRDLEGISKRFYSPKEHSYIQKLPEEKRIKAFYLCWTQKEAVIKASGEGLSFGLEHWSVELDKSTYTNEVCHKDGHALTLEMMVKELNSDYYIALAVIQKIK